MQFSEDGGTTFTDIPQGYTVVLPLSGSARLVRYSFSNGSIPGQLVFNEVVGNGNFIWNATLTPSWGTGVPYFGTTGATGASGLLSVNGTHYGDYIRWGTTDWEVGSTNIALGKFAGRFGQGLNGIAIGEKSGNDGQGIGAIAIGLEAGRFQQGSATIAIGANAGNISQGIGCLAIGNDAGYSNQAVDNGGFVSMALGPGAGRENQGPYCIAIGPNAGRVDQQSGSTVIGSGAGYCNTDVGTIAIGTNAMYYGGAGQNGVAIGNGAAVRGIGNYSIAIGYYAGGVDSVGNQVPANTIVFDARGPPTTPIATPGFYVNPVNGCNAGTYTLNYDTTTGEIFYSPLISDLRLKKNVSGTSLGIDFINRLRPVEFQWKDRKGCSLSSPDGDPLNVISPGVRVHQGLIAQEVKAILNDLSVDSAIYMRIDDIPKKAGTLRFDPSTNGMNGLHGVRYEELITPTIKAVQDVYAIVKQQSEQIAQLQIRIQTLETMVSDSQSRV
jgi:hypothetical protein